MGIFKFRYLIVMMLVLSARCYADTIDHYMNIVNNLPQMEMKPDSDSQAWARSARNVLMLTSETIAESLILANVEASKLGRPLFCLPSGVTIDNVALNELIQQTYKDISSQQSDKNSMTVSKVALIGMKKLYPCEDRL